MKIAIDRLNLNGLADALDRECFVRAVDGLRKAIDPEFWQGTMKALLKDSSALLIEFCRDYDDLKELVGRKEQFEQHSVIPGPAEIEASFSSVYISAEDYNNLTADPEAVINWRIYRVAWLVHTFLQMQGHFVGFVNQTVDTPSQVEVEGLTPDSSIVVTGNSPDFMYRIVRCWLACKRLIQEYLQAKAELLRACGHDVPIVNISLGYDSANAVARAENAVFMADPDAAFHLVNMLRWTFIEVFNLREQLDAAILAQYTTVGLYVAVLKAGLELSETPEVVGNVLVSLEEAVACATPLAIGELYPFYRLLRSTVDKVAAMSDSDASQTVAQVLRQGAVRHGAP